MSSLAHEGNPKEDQIIITGGSVLSTAQLDIDFQFFGPGGGGAGLNQPFNVSSSCPQVFTWPAGREYIPFNYNSSVSGGTITTFTDQLQDQLANTQYWLDLDIESKPNCCGMAIVPFHMENIPTMSFQTDQVFPVHDIVSWRVSFQSVQDTPYAGICAWVEDGSTVDNFTGYVLAANYELGITKFMKYVHQSLCTEGTILGIINTVPRTANDTMTISVYTDPNAASVSDVIWQLVAEVKNSAGTNLGNSPIDLQVHDSLMDVRYTMTGRGTVFTEQKNSKQIVTYVYYDKDGKPVYNTKFVTMVDGVETTPAAVIAGHRHNRANVGFVALGNHPLGQDTGTFVGGQNQLFFGGTLTLGASASFYGLRINLDSYSFGTGTVT